MAIRKESVAYGEHVLLTEKSCCFEEGEEKARVKKHPTLYHEMLPALF